MAKRFEIRLEAYRAYYKKKRNDFLNQLPLKYGRYAIIVWRNSVLRKMGITSESQLYLFILSPPYCGSTLMHEILSSSAHVSSNNTVGTREGQTLPIVKNILFRVDRRWDENHQINWHFIKDEWHKYWDPRKKIFLEKSPPHIIRAPQIAKVFRPSKFIVIYRSPYAHAEGLMRRNGKHATEAAQFAIMCLKYQKQNLKHLGVRALAISYEELTEHTESATSKIIEFIPDLQSLNTKKKFEARNMKAQKMPIYNFNKDKLARISESDRKAMNEVFRKNTEVLHFFGYEILDKNV